MATETIEVTDHKLLVAGERLETGEWSEVKSPYDGTVIGRVPKADAAVVTRAIDAAQAAFESDDFPQHERAAVLDRAAHIVREREDELTMTIAAEAGKPVKTARVEAQRCVGTLTFSAVEARKLTGEMVPMEAGAAGEGKLGYVLRLPVGVVGAISPFNFPLNLVAHKLGPSIAAGNATVLKPAGQTPISAIKLAEILYEAGLPENWLHVITGPGSEVGNAIVDRRAHRRHHLHRLGAGRLGHPRQGRPQEGQPRAGLDRAADRPLRRRLGDRRRQGQAARLLARGPELHLGAADPRPRIDVRRLQQALRQERRGAGHRRSDGRGDRRRTGDLAGRPRPGQVLGRRGRRRGRRAAHGRRAGGRGPLPGADRHLRAAARREGLVRGDLRAGGDPAPLLGLRASARPRKRRQVRPPGRRLHPRHRPRAATPASASSSAACWSTRCPPSAPTRCPTAASRTRATRARAPPTPCAS